jgi:iron complex outermembrane receptor protein
VWLRSLLDLPGGTELDANFRFVDELASPRVPAYAELTLHLGFRRGASPEFAMIGDNLLHGQHAEFGALDPRPEYPRSVFGQITWRF